ncbi:hypothetical protein F383_18894 [Gossypium arboreum]|uniref:Uncharacterized protein n=1 Tax=Gossypium arboreum TaxID=29729 RepID=A0A0B0NNN5_GOSAR|nr:hypothetical protein F383_18894 [Gossypium arboreum]
MACIGIWSFCYMCHHDLAKCIGLIWYLAL